MDKTTSTVELAKKLKTSTEEISQWNRLSRDEKRRFNLESIDLSNACLDKLYMDNCELNLSGANFSCSSISMGALNTAILCNANFDRAILTDVDFTCANLSGATFREAVLKGNLRGVKMARASLEGVDFSGALLQEVNLLAADIRGANFQNAQFNNVNFKNAAFDGRTVFPEGFRLDESALWMGDGHDPRLLNRIEEMRPDGSLDFESFLDRLVETVDPGRVKKAIKLLKKDNFHLYSIATSDSLIGIVKSQSDPKLVYACSLSEDGQFGCCTQNLNTCGGLRGSLCKHILVLLIGETKAGNFSPTVADIWARASILHSHKIDKNLMAETFIQFKGAESGEVDWRPSHTIPEDFYAF